MEKCLATINKVRKEQTNKQVDEKTKKEAPYNLGKSSVIDV